MKSLLVALCSFCVVAGAGWSSAPSSGGTPTIPESLGTVKVVADTVQWTEAMGERLELSEAISFVGYPDSSFESQPFNGGIAYSFPGVSHFYANIAVGAGFRLTQVSVFLKLGSSRTFSFRVHRLQDLGGEAILDSTVTMNSSQFTQTLTWNADSIELYDDSISVEIEDDWGQDFTLEYDSTTAARLYVADFEGTFFRQDGIDPGIYISGIETVPATVAVEVGSVNKASGSGFSSGLYVPNLMVDSLVPGNIIGCNIVGESSVYTNGIMTLTDTCFTSSGDMLVFVNGLITKFVPTP